MFIDFDRALVLLQFVDTWANWSPFRERWSELAEDTYSAYGIIINPITIILNRYPMRIREILKLPRGDLPLR